MAHFRVIRFLQSNMDSEKDYEWLVLVNANASGGKGVKIWDKLSVAFVNQRINFHAYISHTEDEAKELIAAAIEKGRRKFIITGGDGAVNLFVNVIMLKFSAMLAEIIFAIVPLGTGNDFSKSLFEKFEIKKLLLAIQHKSVRSIDCGKITYENGNTQFFVNVAGMGFDALVVEDVNLAKKRGRDGKFIYLLYLIKHLFSYKYPVMHIKIKNYSKQKEFLTVLCGNGSYAGGGMKLVPNARPNDGLLHITLVERINLLKVILNIARLYSGSFLSLREVSELITEEIEISANKPVFMQLDGEKGDFLPAKISIINGVLNIISSEKN